MLFSEKNNSNEMFKCPKMFDWLAMLLLPMRKVPSCSPKTLSWQTLPTFEEEIT